MPFEESKLHKKYKMKDMHSKDMHPKDMHPKEMHLKDYHTKDYHTKDMHSKDMHPKAMKVQGKILRVMGNGGTKNNDMPFKQLDIENAKAMDFNIGKPKEMFEKPLNVGAQKLVNKLAEQGIVAQTKDMHAKDMHAKDHAFPKAKKMKKKLTNLKR